MAVSESGILDMSKQCIERTGLFLRLQGKFFCVFVMYGSARCEQRS